MYYGVVTATFHKKLQATVLLIGAAALPITAGARAVVLQSTGPSAGSFPAGLVLAEPLLLKLRRGDHLTILDTRGTRELEGPTFVDDRKGKNVPIKRLPTWEALTGGRPIVRAAATRRVFEKASSGPSQPSTEQVSLWAIDTSIAGNWCMPDGQPLGLWRSQSSGELRLNVIGGEESFKVTFSEGQSLATWPSFRERHINYVLAQAVGVPKVVTIQLVNVGLSSGELATDLARAGCYQQLAILIAE